MDNSKRSEAKNNYQQNWTDIKKFISESRDYRIRDEVTQKYQVENIEALKNQVKTQNGRVFTLEKWKEEIEIKIKAKRDNSANLQAYITITATVIMAIATAIMLFKK